MSSVITANMKLAIENIDLLDYFNKYVVGRKSGVRELSDSTPATLCPFHKETDPSFHQYIDKKSPISKAGVTPRRFKCFGCGVGGTVVELFIRTELVYNGVHFQSKDEASIALLNLYGLGSLVQKSEEDVFSQALSKIKRFNKVTTDSMMSISKFSKMNLDILGSNVSEDIKRRKFAEIDKMACAVCILE